jgi:DNA-binding FadR family transcriptional regulator
VEKSDDAGNGGQRRYFAVAQSLLSAITNGEYAPGTRLPAHTDIATQAGVSRATAREAFLTLELLGAIEVRHGDGTFVRGPAVRVGGLHGSPLDAPPRELIETRLHIEPVVAALSAKRIDGERLVRLAECLDEQQVLVDELGQVARFVALGLAFHAELASGCGNHLLADIVAQLVNVERHPLWALVNQQALPDAPSRQRQVDEHRAILKYVGEGDSNRASTAMAQHLGSLDQRMFAPTSPVESAT